MLLSQNAATSKVCSDFNEQCEALRVVKMNLQLSSNILVLWITSFRMTPLGRVALREKKELSSLLPAPLLVNSSKTCYLSLS